MYVLVGMVFTSGGQGHFGFYEEGEGQEEKEGDVQIRRSDAALWAHVLIALKDDFAPQQHLAMTGDIFGCHNWGDTIDIW